MSASAIPASYVCSSPDLQGSDTSTTLSGLDPKTTYTFAVAGIDALGNPGEVLLVGCGNAAPPETQTSAPAGGCAASGASGEGASLALIAAVSIAVAAARRVRSSRRTRRAPITPWR
jgi:hypothetical protein